MPSRSHTKAYFTRTLPNANGFTKFAIASHRVLLLWSAQPPGSSCLAAYIYHLNSEASLRPWFHFCVRHVISLCLFLSVCLTVALCKFLLPLALPRYAYSFYFLWFAVFPTGLSESEVIVFLLCCLRRKVLCCFLLCIKGFKLCSQMQRTSTQNQASWILPNCKYVFA